MAVGNIQADGDIIDDWLIPVIGDHYDTINEDEGAPNTTDYIGASQAAGDDNEIDSFNMETIVDVDSVSQVVVWTYGRSVVGGGPEVDINIGGAQGFQEISGWNLAWGWHNATFVIDPPASQADLNAMTVSYRADVSQKTAENHISCMYCAVTYEEVGAEGYAHKVSGISPANIAKVNGVPRANIAKVNGV